MKKTLAVLVAALLGVQGMQAQTNDPPQEGAVTVLWFATGVFVLVVGSIAVVECLHFHNKYNTLPNTFAQWPDEIYSFGCDRTELNGYWSKHRDVNAPGGGYYQNDASGYGMWAWAIQRPWTTNEPVMYSWFISDAPLGGTALFCSSGFRSDTNTMMGPPLSWGAVLGFPLDIEGLTNAQPPLLTMPHVSAYQNASLPAGSTITVNVCESMDEQEIRTRLAYGFGVLAYPSTTNEAYLALSNWISVSSNAVVCYNLTNLPTITRSGDTIYLTAASTNDHNWYAAWFQLPYEQGSSSYGGISPVYPNRVRLAGASGIMQRSLDLKHWDDLMPIKIEATNCTVVVLDSQAHWNRGFYRMRQ